MKKGMIPKFGMGVALAAALAFGSAPIAKADLDDTLSLTEPRGVLVMPFDQTDNHQSYQLVSRIDAVGLDPVDEAVVATHWSFWSKDCRHLADVLICLTKNDTVVVDPGALVGQLQAPAPRANLPFGSSFDLSGEQGFIVVTSYVASTGPSGLDCVIVSVDDIADDQLVGSWVIADLSTNAAFGNDALGLRHGELPDPSTYIGPDTSGLFVQTFNPLDLGDSDVIVIGLEYDDDTINGTGSGRFIGVEHGPLRDRGTPRVQCDLEFFDDLEVMVSLPDVQFDCALFAPISIDQGDNPLIPASMTLDTPFGGFLNLTRCTVIDLETRDRIPVGEEFAQFLFAFHGQAVGQFGTVVSGKYNSLGQE